MTLRLLVIFLVASPASAENAGAVTEPGKCWWSPIELTLAASSGAPAPPGDFGAAIEFLEANTGIGSGLDVTFTGYIVKPRTLRRAVDRWTHWFLDRYAYLYWEPTRSFTWSTRKPEPTGLQHHGHAARLVATVV